MIESGSNGKAGANLISQDTNQSAERLQFLVEEQKQAHAEIILGMTRDLDNLLKEINGLKYERNYARVVISLFLSRMKKNWLLQRLFSERVKKRVITLLLKIGL